MHSALHTKSNINRFYMKRSDGRQGLVSLVDSVEGERGSLAHDWVNSEELSQVGHEEVKVKRNGEFKTRKAKENRYQLLDI